MPTPSVDTTTFDWVPLRPGLSFKPLRLFPDDPDPGTARAEYFAWCDTNGIEPLTELVR